MFTYIRSFFVQPTALDLANEELKRSRRQELQEQSMAEYSAAQAKCHQIMADYERSRIVRLVAYIHEQNKE